MGKRIIVLSLAAILQSCSSHVDTLLNQAFSIINESPDSALTVLGAINPAELTTLARKADYSLSLAMALDKCHIDTAGVELLTPAFKYYSHRGKEDKLAACWYYLGRIQLHSGQRQEAQKSFSTALDHSLNITDDLLLMRLYAQLSALYSSDNNLDEAQKYIALARESASKTTDSLNIWLLQGREATSLSNLGCYREADSLFTLFFSQPVRDSSVRGRFLMNYAKTLLRMDPSEPQRSAWAFEEAVSAGCTPSVDNQCVYAMACEMCGRSSVADGVMQRLDSISPTGRDAGIVSLYKYRILRHRGDVSHALANYEKAVAISDSLVQATLQQSLERSRQDYMQQKALTLEKQGRERLRYSLIIAALLLIIMTGAMFVILGKRKRDLRLREEELEALRDEVAHIISLDQAKDSAIDKLRSSFVSMYKSKFKLLDDLCATYWSPSRTDTKEKIYNEVRQALTVIYGGEKGQKQLESMIDRDLDGAMTKLRADLPGRSDEDFLFIAYLIIGLSPKTIACILDCVPGSVYNRKMRLKERLSRLDSPYRDYYLSLII